MARAGLTPAIIAAAGADLADEIGADRLSMSLVAARLGVKAPSLYKHVASLADLIHRIATLGAIEVGDVFREATQGRAGRDALAAAARALRTYVRTHPGRYAASVGVRPLGPEDPLTAALERTLASFGAVLHDYRLDADQHLHALRMLRSMLHGLATTEAVGGFQLGTDLDESVDWMIGFLDRGLRTVE